MFEASAEPSCAETSKAVQCSPVKLTAGAGPSHEFRAANADTHRPPDAFVVVCDSAQLAMHISSYPTRNRHLIQCQFVPTLICGTQ